MSHMKKKFWHVSNGQVFTGGDETDAKAYADHLRRSYGSLRGVRIYEALTDDADLVLLVYDLRGRTHPSTRAKIDRQWRRVTT